MFRIHTYIVLLPMLILLSVSGCGKSVSPSDNGLNPHPPGGWLGADGREILGFFNLTIDPAAESATITPKRDVSLDKQYLSADKFTLDTKYISLKQNQLCYQDWLSGDITFEATATNLTGIDYFDVWVVILDGYDGDLADPSSWASLGSFESRMPYMSFATDDPDRRIAGGTSDSRVHVWRNPCQHPYVNVDLALVGTPSAPSETPADITPDPQTIQIPIWDMPASLNFRAWVADHQMDSTVRVVWNDIGIPPNFALHDDGLHGDGAASDGLYATGDLPVTELPNGTHEIWIQAISPGDVINVYNKIDLVVGYVDATWDEPVSLRESGYLNQLGYCDLGMDSTGRIHFAWLERLDWGGVYVYRCWYRSYLDGQLSALVNLNGDLLIDGAAMPYLSNPQLVVGPGDEVYVIWHQWDPLGIAKLVTYSMMLKDGNWSEPYRIDASGQHQVYSPHAVCTPSGEIVLVAKDYRDGTYAICATSVESGSNEWPDTTRLYISDMGESLNLESMESLEAAEDGLLYLAVTKRDTSGADNVYVLQIDPGAISSGGLKRVNDPGGPVGRKYYPCVWTDPAGCIGAGWSGVRETGADKRVIYFATSYDGGVTWGEDRILFDGSSSGSILPVVKAYGPDQWGFVFNHNHRNYYMVTFDAGESFSELELLPNYGSTNLPNFIVGEGFDTWHVWRSNHMDIDYNTFLSRRHY